MTKYFISIAILLLVGLVVLNETIFNIGVEDEVTEQIIQTPSKIVDAKVLTLNDPITNVLSTTATSTIDSFTSATGSSTSSATISNDATVATVGSTMDDMTTPNNLKEVDSEIQPDSGDNDQTKDTDTSTAIVDTSKIEGNFLSAKGDANQITLDIPAVYDGSLNLDSVKNIAVKIHGAEGYLVDANYKRGEPILAKDLADGLYKWQATIEPKISEDVRAELQKFRAQGDSLGLNKAMKEYRKNGLLPSREQVENNVQSGQFRIFDGQLVTDIKEE